MDEFINSLKKALYISELKFKPYALFINPIDKNELLKEYPEIEERLVIYPTYMAPRGVAYLADRKEFDTFKLHHITEEV